MISPSLPLHLKFTVVSSEENSSSDCEDSFVAPTRFRVQAVALAVVAGTCWGFGPLGKKARGWWMVGMVGGKLIANLAGFLGYSVDFLDFC